MPGTPKKPKAPKNYLGRVQLQKLLENPKLSIEDIAKRLKCSAELVRKYVEKYGL
jgi:DNA-binding Lrp family transcriptional regulator